MMRCKICHLRVQGVINYHFHMLDEHNIMTKPGEDSLLRATCISEQYKILAEKENQFEHQDTNPYSQGIYYRDKDY